MKTFAAIVLKYRILIIIITLGLTVFFGFGLTKVRINSDMLSYLREDPVVQLYNRIGDDYSGNAVAMIAVESENIFTTETLSFIRDLTEAYSQIPGVSTVMSLTNIMDITKTEDGLEIRKLIDKYEIPESPEELSRLRTYTLDKDMYAGQFISLDGKITLLMCRLQPDARKEDVAKQIQAITEENKGNHVIYYSGLPLQMLEINALISDDMKRLIPLVILMVLLTLYFSFRSIRGVVLPLLTVGVATIWGVGLMGWMNVEMSIISNIMPVILIAIGTAYGIHFLSKANEELHPGAEKKSVIADALSEVGVPIILTGLTTLIGFLSFTGSYLTAITDFGIFTAFGVGVAMVLSVTFIPALLSLLKLPKASNHSVQQDKHLLIGFMDALGNVVLKNEKLIIAGGLVVILLAVIGIPRIKTEVNLIEYFPEDSGIRISDVLMRDNFGGSTPIQMVMYGNLKDPFVLKEILRLEKYMESLPDVNNTQSLADLICEMNDVMNGHYTIPETKEQVANLMFMLEGEEMLDQLVNKDYSEGIIQARFGRLNTARMVAAVEAMNHYIQSEMDTSINVTLLTELDPDARQKLLDFQIERISTAILYDAQNRMPSVQLDQGKIVEHLRQLAPTTFFPLARGHQDALQTRLVDFFIEEADVEIDSDQVISNVVAAILAAIIEQPASEEGLLSILQKTVPLEYWEDDPEILDDTMEFMFPIIQEKQNFNRIDSFVAKLLHLFPAELQEHKKFRNDLRDDLWVLNEEILGLPEGLNLENTGEQVSLNSEQSGMLIVLKQMDESIVGSQLNSLLWALLLVAILMIIQFRSIKMGLVVTSPIVLTILVNFAIMGYANVPLEMASVMIAGVAIGIGVDYSIHFSSRFKLESSKQPEELFALDKTLETTGRAILINALTVSLGFIILVWGNIVPIQRFGWMIALTMVFSACGALTFLPALILVLKRLLFKNRQYPRLKAPIYYRLSSALSSRKPVVNIGLGGLRIHSDEKLKVGKRVKLELILPNDTNLTTIGRIVWQRSLPAESDAKYDIGLRFVDVSDDTLHQLSDVLEKYAETGEVTDVS